MKCILHTVSVPQQFTKAALQYLGPVPKLALMPYPFGFQVITDAKATGMQQAIDSLREYVGQYADPSCLVAFNQPATMYVPKEQNATR